MDGMAEGAVTTDKITIENVFNALSTERKQYSSTGNVKGFILWKLKAACMGYSLRPLD